MKTGLMNLLMRVRKRSQIELCPVIFLRFLLDDKWVCAISAWLNKIKWQPMTYTLVCVCVCFFFILNNRDLKLVHPKNEIFWKFHMNFLLRFIGFGGVLLEFLSNHALHKIIKQVYFEDTITYQSKSNLKIMKIS